MKIKSLLIAAATLAVGAVTSQAQVYSQNIVGYVNTTIPANGFALLSNPLNTGNNILTNVIPVGAAPNNTTKAYIYSGGNFVSYTLRASGWSPSAAGVNVGPGAGFFIQNTASTNITITFAGSVLTGTNLMALSAGYNLIASQVPQSGLVQTGLGLPAVNNDKVYTFNPVTGQYNSVATRRTSSWTPTEPTVGTNSFYGVSEAFFYFAGSATTWTNVFNP